jgi:beta-phosphoglucomutase family hydrolase
MSWYCFSRFLLHAATGHGISYPQRGGRSRDTLPVVLGLPDNIRVCLFDLDGVLTDTAAVHRKAWAAAFDPVLKAHGQQPFSDQDYNDHVDGKPRLDGVRDFLSSRGLDLPEGSADDSPETDSVQGIAARKNVDLLRRIKEDGVKVFPGSRRYLEAAMKAGLRRIVVSSSANTKDVLEVTGLAELIEDRVDGVTIASTGMAGKPAPDSFLAGAQRAGVEPSRAVVFEDATSGVQAGRSGNFGFVVGVNRLDADHGAALKSNGADVVVDDLADLL